MPCYDNYITINSDTPSRTGLYVVSLPGIEVQSLSSLTKSDQANYLVYWADVYKRAWDNLVSEVAEKLHDRFFVDLKLLARETSVFQTSYNTGTSAGIRLEFDLPKYARIHVIDVEVWAENAYDSPDFVLEFRDTNDSGELLHSEGNVIEAGRNTVFIDEDFEVDSLFIGYDPSVVSLKKTENKQYNIGYINWDKVFCMYDCGFGIGSVRQINGGGLNVNYVVYCSIEKFLCENINLFKQAFLWKLGVEILSDRIYGDTVNCFTALTPDRAKELTEYYVNEYSKKLENGVRGHKVNEDPYCFSCKSVVTHKTILP